MNKQRVMLTALTPTQAVCLGVRALTNASDNNEAVVVLQQWQAMVAHFKYKTSKSALT